MQEEQKGREMRTRGKQIKLIKSILISMVFLLMMQMIVVGVFGSFSAATMHRQQQEYLDCILEIYQENLNDALNIVEDDLQDILSRRSDLQMLTNESALERWKASYNLTSLLKKKHTFKTVVDGYMIVDSVYNGFLVSRSSNISYGDLNLIHDYFLEQTKEKIKNSGWTQALIGEKVYLLKYYNYGKVCIGAVISDQKIRQILAQGYDTQNLVEFYVTDSEHRMICSSDPECYYGEDIKMDAGILGTSMLWRERKIMNGKYYVVGRIEKNIFWGQSAHPFIILALLFVSVMFILWLMYFLNREIIRPINVLSETSRRIWGGDMSVRPQYTCRNKEMNELKSIYVSMLDNIMDLRRKEYEQVIRVRDSELKYMHMQLKPHFFLNALSTINSMAYQNRIEDIHEFIQVFSRNIRYMFKVGLHTVSLEDEVKNLEDYMEMQKLLYGERFYYYFEISEGMSTYKIPQMLLHTFMENIFKHIIDMNSFTTIFMRCFLGEHNGQKMLKIEIQNSGGHFSEEILHLINDNIEIKNEGMGIGLTHAKTILSIMYRQDNLLHLGNEEPDGTKVTVWIPKEVQDEIINH